jgi:farnesyl diphosphate synthase
MDYALMAGGKRLRPLLVYAAGKLFHATDEQCDAAAAAVELIHTYSLIHDDLPAMDDDDLRRGKPSCHIAFDEATAILAGDALQCLAFELITANTNPLPNNIKVQLVSTLAKAIGHQGMAGGQMLDLEAETKPLELDSLNQVHLLKTGALITASIVMGALVSGHSMTSDINLLEKFGNCLGLGFQIRDDILDVTGTTEQLGKPQGSDQHNAKATYPSLIGIEQAEEKALAFYQEATSYFNQLNGDTELLQTLSQQLIIRHS